MQPPDGTHRNARRLASVVAMAAIWLTAPAMSASAHGDHDARPLVRHVGAGPYTVSLWQVYPDSGSAMLPHLIVMFDDLPSGPDTQVEVRVGSAPVDVAPSITSLGAWETTVGVETADRVTVTISDRQGSWDMPLVTIPPPVTAVLPMRLLISISIFLATAVAWWAGGRTARAWKRPLTYRNVGLEG